MSIRIEIGDRYVVTSDAFQFILHEKKTAATGKSAGKEWFSTIGYYPKLNQLVTSLLMHEALTGEASTFAELSEQIEKIGQECLAAFVKTRKSK